MQSPSGHTLALLILALLGGWPEIDPQARLDPYLATVARVRITLKRWLQGYGRQNCPLHSGSSGPSEVCWRTVRMSMLGIPERTGHPPLSACYAMVCSLTLVVSSR